MEFKKTFSIGEASSLTGISIKTLRYWEIRGYIPIADRIICGEKTYRRFKETDLKIMQHIKKYLDDGYNLIYAAEKVKKETKWDGGKLNGK